MLICNFRSSRDALRRAVEVLDSIDDGSLVELNSDGSAFTVLVYVNPDGRAPSSADQVFAARYPIDVLDPKEIDA